MSGSIDWCMQNLWCSNAGQLRETWAIENKVPAMPHVVQMPTRAQAHRQRSLRKRATR